jgi:transcriptional regulator with XRE-family HTH domain
MPRTRPLKDTQAQAESLNGLIALRVRARRKSLGLSLETLASVSGVDVPTLQRLEQRCAGCPAVDLWRIAEALGVSISELCFPVKAGLAAFPRSFAPPGEPTDEHFSAMGRAGLSKRTH